MRRFLLLFSSMLMSPAIALAQSNPNFQEGQAVHSYDVPGRTGWNTIFQNKADVLNGTLASPTISGGSITGATLNNSTLANPTITNPTVSGNLTFLGTGVLQLPSGTTSQEPGVPSVGMMRWNTTTGRLEVYDGSTWRNFVRLSGDTISGALAVSGVTTLSGGATVPTPATQDAGTDVVNAAWVRAQGYGTGGASGVTTFDTRNGAVTLNLNDVVTALGFTPANTSAPSFTGGITVSGGITSDTLTVNGSAIFGSTGALQLPAGTTLQEPGLPSAGMLRWNTTTGRIETYSGSAWQQYVRLSGGDTIAGSLTITGAATLSGGATSPTPSLSDSSTDVVNAAWVKAQGYSTGSGTFGSLAASGTTQGTAAAVTTLRVVVTTSTASANGVELPAVSAGESAQIWNEGSYPISVYPQSGQVIGSLSANAPIQIGVGSKADFISTSSQWYAQ